MKKILLIVMICCIVTATAVFASTQTNLVSSKSCTKRYPWTLYNKTTKKCVCPTGIKRKRKTRCDIVTSTQWTWSIKTWGIVSTSSLLSTWSKPVFASWFNATWYMITWVSITWTTSYPLYSWAKLDWVWSMPTDDITQETQNKEKAKWIKIKPQTQQECYDWKMSECNKIPQNRQYCQSQALKFFDSCQTK